MVTMENYEEYLLLHTDGELGEADEKALEAFMTQHPELQHVMEQYMATKLLPDMTMVYEGKEALLKKPTVIALGQWKMYAAAACVAILVVIGLWKWNSPTTTNINIVQVNNNNINIAAPKDTFLTKQDVINKTIADADIMAIKQKKQQTLALQPKAHHYAADDHKKTSPEREAFASIGILPVKQLPLKPAMLMPKDLDVSMPASESAGTEPTEKPANALLAKLPIKQEGISEIAEAVNTKIEKVRSIRDNIKNTDLSVRLWNKELFVVKL